MNTVDKKGYEGRQSAYGREAAGHLDTKRQYGQRVGTVVALMIFCVFAMSLFAVLALGAGAYRSISEKPRQGYEERVCLSYVWTKVKNGDEAGQVYVKEFAGLPALWLDEEYGETLYHTVIYHYENYVYELFFEAGYEFLPRDGIALFKSGELLMEQQENGLIKVTVGGESGFISPRGRGAE